MKQVILTALFAVAAFAALTIGASMAHANTYNDESDKAVAYRGAVEYCKPLANKERMHDQCVSDVMTYGYSQLIIGGAK